jgi:hypothetical protein
MTSESPAQFQLQPARLEVQFIVRHNEPAEVAPATCDAVTRAR